MMKTIYQKFVTLSGILLITATFCTSLLAPAVHAEASVDSPISASYTTFGAVFFEGNCDRTFLGLKSWDCGVSVTNQNSLKGSIWQIAANIAHDITVVAAYLILGFIIYGGYLYIFSGGDPGKVAAGKKTLIHAFIGIAIVMSANLIMNTVNYALVGSDSLSGSANAANLVTSSINWIIGVAGIAAAIFVVYGGVAYMTSGGDPGKVQKAKQILLYALIGLAIVGLSQVISSFVVSTIANSQTSLITNPTTITKEVYVPSQIN